jgi:hypothetical protein
MPGKVSVNELLQTGAMLGFTGGGDCHDGRVGFTSEEPDAQGDRPHSFAIKLAYRCGMTAAAMPELTREDLVTALRERKTYATTGARILLDFSVSGIEMGDSASTASVECRGTIHAVDAICTVEIVRNGESIELPAEACSTLQKADCLDQADTGDVLSVSFHWPDPAPVNEPTYYYLRVRQRDGQVAWSSPVWIKPAGR